MPEDALWKRIDAFQLDDPEAEFSFSDRLARENGWTPVYTHRCIEEYKRFMYLVCIAKHPLTPSDQVDQVWHLHLLYTESYWTEFCEQVLERKIHHGPTKGGNEARTQYTDWYAETKKLYQEVFLEEVPTDIWPSSKIRFSEINFQRINLHKNIVLPRIKYWLNKWKP